MSGAMRGRSVLAALLLLPATAVAQVSSVTPTPATPLPPAHNGVITPPGSASGVDPHMPVMHPKRPGRMPVIRPPSQTPGGGAVIDPR